MKAFPLVMVGLSLVFVLTATATAQFSSFDSSNREAEMARQEAERSRQEAERAREESRRQQQEAERQRQDAERGFPVVRGSDGPSLVFVPARATPTPRGHKYHRCRRDQG